jgi:tetratricopeptide (TPR) repeat protein
MGGASRPADFSSYLLTCAEHSEDAGLRQRARESLVSTLAAIVEAPPKTMTPDDVADAWRVLAGAHAALGDRGAAAIASQRRLGVLETAAADAPTPAAASAYDAGRVAAYRNLGRTQDALDLLQARVRDLPNSAEAWARLAGTLTSLKRQTEALEAIDKAVALSEIPRKLRHLATKAALQTLLGDLPGAVRTLETEVDGHKQLRAGHANQQDLQAAEARLTQARARLSSGR